MNDINDFGKALVEQVRDEAINHAERLFAGKFLDEYSLSLSKKILESKSGQDGAFLATPDIVDVTITYLLGFLDSNEEMKAKWKSFNLSGSDENLVGSYVAADGWVARFSKSRRGYIAEEAE